MDWLKNVPKSKHSMILAMLDEKDLSEEELDDVIARLVKDDGIMEEYRSWRDRKKAPQEIVPEMFLSTMSKGLRKLAEDYISKNMTEEMNAIMEVATEKERALYLKWKAQSEIPASPLDVLAGLSEKKQAMVNKVLNMMVDFDSKQELLRDIIDDDDLWNAYQLSIRFQGLNLSDVSTAPALEPEILITKTDFLKDLKPTIRSMIETQLDEGEFENARDLLEIKGGEAVILFDKWRRQTYPDQMSLSGASQAVPELAPVVLITMDDFLIDLKPTIRKMIETQLDEGDFDGARDLLEIKGPEAVALFDQWRQQSSGTQIPVKIIDKSSFMDGLSDKKRGMVENSLNAKDYDYVADLLESWEDQAALNAFNQWRNAQSGKDIVTPKLSSSSSETEEWCKIGSTQPSRSTPYRHIPITEKFYDANDTVVNEKPKINPIRQYSRSPVRRAPETQNQGNSSRSRSRQNSPSPVRGTGHSKLQSSVQTPTLKTDKFPKNMNLLILGETGVGKSTFINGLVNYLKYGSIEEAMDGGVEILIRSQFTLTDADYRSREIISEPTIAEERTSAVNESSKRGASATQDPKSYVFSYGPNDEKTIRIIDTPGIGDTRGVDQDKKNFSKILNFISDFSDIHAVCILIKPNTARLTIAFRFCIDELLVHLHKSASQNIIFCFTNTRGTLYKPGDTLPTLREHLDNLAANRNIRIPLDKSTLFSFDSESFRFLCAYQNRFEFSETEKRDFASSWRHSVDETLRLFERIAQLPAHSVQDTLSLNNTRNLILSLTRPLGEIAKTQMLNMQLIDDKLREIEQNSAAGKDLLGKLNVDKVVVNSIPLNKPQTVCTAKGCVDYHSMQAETNVLQTIYKTVCHEDCQLQGVQAEVVPNPELQKCAAMSGTGSPCSRCGCRWDTHMHILYRLETSVEKGTDPEVQRSIDRKDEANKTIQIFLDNENQKLEELKQEHNFITECCAEFAAFLSQNSIIPYNDSYGQYIDHLIKEETEKVNIGGGDRLLEELQVMKMEYQSQVEMLQSSINCKARDVKSIREVDEMIKQLSSLKHCGKTIQEIKNIRIHTIRKNAADPSSKIRVSGGMFGGIKKAVKRFTH